jgi:hypothetical protein
MQYTMPSRVLTNLLLPDIDENIDERIVALSPPVSADPLDPGMEAIFTLLLSSGGIRLSIPLFATGISVRPRKRLSEYTRMLEASVPVLMCLASGMPVTARAFMNKQEVSPDPGFIVDLSLGDGGYLRLGIPTEFFGAFMRLPCGTSEPDSIEEGIVTFFLRHRACFPHTGVLIDCLPPRDLEGMFHSLLVRGLLSAYQASLLIRAFPESAGRIRSALPASLVKDGAGLIETRRLRISQRDMAGGVYSVDEALFRLLHEASPPGVLRAFRGLRTIISELRLSRSLPEGDFWSFCESSAPTGALYEAIGLCGEYTSRIAFSGAPDSFATALRSCVSGRAADELLSAGNHGVGMNELLEAKTRFAAALRRSHVRRGIRGRTDIGYLLSCLNAPVDFDTLLVEAGWFRIATSLKGVRGEPRRRLLEGVARPARYLIEDMLDGTINPDILHDEARIRSAGVELSECILELYERGAIRLSAQCRLFYPSSKRRSSLYRP